MPAPRRRRTASHTLRRWPARLPAQLPALARVLWPRLARQPLPTMSARTQWAWLLVLALLFTSFIPGEARGPFDRQRLVAGVRLFYAPQTNLAEIDQALIGSARTSIDAAAYVLTDRSVMNALIEAAGRGVRVRLYLDPDQPASRSRDSASPFWTLLRTKGVEHRVKTGGRDLMHLKAYQVDGRILRTGSANFSVSGARYQDNDLILIEGRDAVAPFIRNFELIWRRNGNMPFPAPNGQ